MFTTYFAGNLFKNKHLASATLLASKLAATTKTTLQQSHTQAIVLKKYWPSC